MKKIKSENTHHKKIPMDNGKQVILFGGIGVIVLIILAIIIIENQGARIKINNETGMKLEYVKTYFVATEGALQDPILFENIESGDKLSTPIEKMYLYGKEANLEIRFKFADYEDEYLIDSGYFNDIFKGKVNISFTKAEDGIVKLKVKASNGILPSKRIICDEETEVFYKEGRLSE